MFNGPVYTWLTSGDTRFQVGFLIDQPDRDDDAGGDLRVADGAHLHHRLYGRRPRLPAFLQLHLAVHLLHADAGDGQQFHATVLRLGSGGPGFLPADRFLVRPADRDLRQPESLSGESRRRLRLPARHRPGADGVRHAGLCRGVRQCGQSRCRYGADPRHVGEFADCDLHPAVHRCDGQVGAVSAACLAARFDGRPDPDLRADPRRDHGDRRYLHGGAHVAAVRVVRYGAVVS